MAENCCDSPYHHHTTCFGVNIYSGRSWKFFGDFMFSLTFSVFFGFLVRVRFNGDVFFVASDAFHVISIKKKRSYGLVESEYPNRHFQGKFKNTKFNMFFWSLSISFFNLGSLSNSTWHVPWNRSKPSKLVPCRRLLQRRDPSISRGRATGAAAARGPMAPSTE